MSPASRAGRQPERPGRGRTTTTSRVRDRKRTRPDSFERVRAIGLELPGVEAATRYDGSPVLKFGGCFLAGLPTDPAAEPDTLVVRMELDDRAALLEDAPQAYYLTAYHERHPVVLVRLAQVDDGALRDLLAVSWRLTAAKTRRGRHLRPASEPLSASRPHAPRRS